MSHTLLIFSATFIAVFTLGLQSLNVNQGHYFAAAVTSLGIGAGHVLLYRYMPSADWLELGGYFAGGVAGITSSMWFHRRAKAVLGTWFQRRPTAPEPMDEHQDVAHCGGYSRRDSDTH